MAAPKPTLVHGTQVKLPEGSFTAPIDMVYQPTVNPVSESEIQAAAQGGLIGLASGGSSCYVSPSTSNTLKTAGSEVTLPMQTTYSAPLETYMAPAINPLSQQQIQSAATGGSIQHMAGGGFPADPGTMHGHAFNFYHPAMGLNPLQGGPAIIAKAAKGGKIVEHRPEFYSEGGLNHFVKGGGTGTSDSVPAMLANGEFVIPADVVSSLGDGSNDSGAKILDEFLSTVRKHKQSHDAKHLPPDSKGPLGYLLEAKKKVK
jgi:hypothetical protein